MERALFYRENLEVFFINKVDGLNVWCFCPSWHMTEQHSSDTIILKPYYNVLEYETPAGIISLNSCLKP